MSGTEGRSGWVLGVARPEGGPRGDYSSPAQRAHEKLVHRLWQAIATADLAELHEVMLPTTTWLMSGRSPLAGRFQGVEAVIDWLALVGESCDDMHSELTEVYTSASGAVARYRIEAWRADHHLEMEHLLLIEVAGGRVAGVTFAPLDQEKYDRFWLAD